MTTQEWLNNVVENGHTLLSLVASFHPASGRQPYGLPITAPNAEKACEPMRKQIEKNLDYALESPHRKFLEAVKYREAGAIYTILQETWLGVPESTDCWSLTGFKECVNLLDDPYGQ